MNRTIITAIAIMFASAAIQADEPPANMQQHLEWCAAAKPASEQIARYEGFWRAYLPADEGGVQRADGDGGGYGDGAHVMHVRLCAYRLLKLYIQARNQERTAYFAQWLEATDSIIGVRPSKIPKQQSK